MSGAGAPALSINGSELRVGVVAASWHTVVMGGLLGGAQRALAASRVADVEVMRVPGAFELPLGAAELLTRCDCVVALGVVIRGGTPHFEYVCKAATDGLLRVSLDAKRPVGFGLLTCDDEQQALDRAGLADSAEDKGAEAAEAAMAMAVIMQSPAR
ncbi:MAG TPA: 6,7-dimethyl-8-ribityllumazine synthase [Actinomycetes bacterium]|nr:6,7-dimethyl-8-ribityllumazine synthase [Actinomycetes bacterium]